VIQYQPIQIPLVGGISQKTDPRALAAPALAAAVDIAFDNVGGIQTRPPYDKTSITGNIFGGGTITNVRRLVANGDELLAFTADHLYSWDASLSLWIDKGLHLAVAVDETPVFETTSDQTQTDRAELGGTVMFAWRDEANPTSGGAQPTPAGQAAPPGTLYVAAIDKTTGAVVLPPYAVSLSETRPRLIALDSKILLFTIDAINGNFGVRAISPANIVVDVTLGRTVVRTGGSLAGTPGPVLYDVVRVGLSNTACFALSRSTKTVYTVGTVTGALVIATTDKAQTCDGPIAIAPAPDALNLQVVRCNGTAVKADLVDITTFADVHVDVTLGTGNPTSQVTVCFNAQAIAPGVYRATAWWSVHEYEFVDAFTVGTVQYATIDTTGTAVAAGLFIPALSLASRAFYYDGHVYVNLVFSQPSRVSRGVFAQLQNTYFLYRDDRRLCGQSAPDVAGGYVAVIAYDSVIGHLPGVVSNGAGGFAWCAQRRRRVALSNELDHDYSARSPLDTLITFDDDRARRCARLGETLYVTGSEVLQYDGEQLVEVGFHLYPWRLTAAPNVPAGAAIPDGDYTFKSTFRWDNAKGERERSTTALYLTITLAGGPSDVEMKLPVLHVTRKANAKSPVVIEAWRTKKDPGSVEDPMYLVTSLDPGNAALTYNRFVANDQSGSAQAAALSDNLTDDELTLREENDETGGVLESLAPPPATIITASQDRVFLAGIAGDPHRVWYSKVRVAGHVAAFDDVLTIDIPHAGGDITAIALLAETLVVFRESAIYVVPGEGFSNTGEGQNYGPARRVPSDCGAVGPDAVAVFEQGLLFKSVKGWYVLTTGWDVQYVGGPIADFDDETIIAVHALESSHHIRVETNNRMLVWDYLVNQWCEWTGATDVRGACVWQGRHVFWDDALEVAQIEQLDPPSFADTGYGLDIETPWIKLNDLAGRGKVRKVLITGEWRSAHKVQIKTARDYQYTAENVPAWFESKLLTPDTSIVGDRVQLAHGPRYARCEAMKFRITVVDVASTPATSPGGGGGGPATSPGADLGDPPSSGECLRLTGLAIEAGIEAGITRTLSAAQKG
jgi:hypothetical protein